MPELVSELLEHKGNLILMKENKNYDIFIECLLSTKHHAKFFYLIASLTHTIYPRDRWYYYRHFAVQGTEDEEVMYLR